MTYVLPFRLKVPSQNEHFLTDTTTISYKFRGLLRLEEDHLYIEWTGTGTIEEKSILGTDTDVRALPLESFELPLEEIRMMRFLGNWWWPRVVLSGMTLNGLRIIPSEQNGSVTFYIDRSDRQTAEALVAAVMANRNV